MTAYEKEVQRRKALYGSPKFKGGYCQSCGRDYKNDVPEHCSDDCPHYWEEADGTVHPEHQEVAS